MSSIITNPQEEIMSRHYQQFKKDMKAKYNWSPDEGVFRSIITWTIKSTLIEDLSKVGANTHGRRTVKKITN